MRAFEFLTEDDEEQYEARAAFGRVKPGVKSSAYKMKFRCTSGPRKSRIVAHPSQCFAHPNIAQSQRMKRTRARTAPIQARKTKRAKKLNVASRIVRQLNKLIK
jgi:hypothetical protein